MQKDSLYKLALTCLPGIGNQTVKQLLSYCGSASSIFTTKPGKLLHVPGIGQKNINSLRDHSPYLKEAEKKLHILEKTNTSFTFFQDENYPERLRHCIDSPILFYYKGKPNFNQEKIISIVGTRNATDYGRTITEQIIKELKRYNPIIVSGLAYGIDITAHKAALAENLTTWAVIAGGHEVLYPSAHKRYYEEIVLNGSVISEYMPFEEPIAANFPARNRIIAGISDGTLVIEAKEKGGALITADIANSYDREVFTTPGSINNPSSQGCHNLVKQNKAHLITSAEDIGRLLGWDSEETGTSKDIINFTFTENESRIINLLKDKELHIDEISWLSGFTAGSLASLLLTLEMQGFVKALPGKKFRYIYS